MGNMNFPAASDRNNIKGGVHANRRHDSAHKHVSGTAIYTDDIPTPEGTKHVAFGMSNRARARVTKLDLEPVLSAEGVVCVLTADDITGRNDVSPSPSPEPLLPIDGEIHYHGQPLFAVVADSHLAARRAARLAVVEYEELTPILTLDDAIAAESWIEEPRIYQRGDANAAIDAAPHMVEGVMELGGQEHFYLEGMAALAVPGEDDDIKVHSSTQHPTEIQHKVAEFMGVPFHNIVVEVRRMGGGFGGKESQGNHLACICALAAKKLGVPVKMRYDRDDDMVMTGKRHDFRITYRAGFDDDGRLTGVAFEQAARCGWAADLSLPVCDRAMLHADNAYFLPAVKITSLRCRTNTVSNTAFRGFGGPQGIVGIERVMDHIAHQLGKDPVDVRMINYYDAPETGERNLTPYFMEVEDSVSDQITAELLESSDYRQRRAEIDAFNAKSEHLKKGLALTPVKFGISFTLTHLNQAAALVHVYTDGSVYLNHGGTEMGQGLFTKVAQVAAESFQIDMDRVKITATNTGRAANTSATAASSGSDLNGMAVKNACDQIKDRLTAFAAERFQCAVEDVQWLPGRIQAGTEEMGFNELVSAAYQSRIPLSASGFYATPKINWDRIQGKGRPFYYFSYGAAVTEVIVDGFTGEYRLTRADILHDVGKSLNPVIDRGQVEGAYIQGSGWLTTEELVWDDKGRLMTHAPSTYKIPAASDRPDMNIELWEKGYNREETIYRSKAVGEPPFVLGVSSWAALSDAVSAFGDGSLYADLDAPATPERVLKAADRQRGIEWE